MNKVFSYNSLAVFCFLIFAPQLVFTQNNDVINLKLIDSFLVKNLVKKADSTLQTQIAYLENENHLDSLYKYPYYIGKIALLKTNAKKAKTEANNFVKTISSKTENKRFHYKTLLSLADFYDEIGENKLSLETTKQALEFVLQVQNATPEEIGKVRYNIGATYLTLGNINEGKTYFKNALLDFESYEKTSKNQLSDGYNAVGASMWLTSKLDSAKYYYDKAEKTIISAKGDSIMNLYLGTVIKSNVSLLEYTQGNLSDAVNIQNKVISNYEIVITNYLDENIVTKAKRYQARAISNLAVFYNEQGNLTKANDIINYSYLKKKQLLEPKDITLASSLIQIGQSQISLKELDQAIVNINEGLQLLAKYNPENYYWKATALHALADAHAGKENFETAKNYYLESELLFKKALGDEYDVEFLNFLQNKAVFLAELDDKDNAISTAKEAYNYVEKFGGEHNFSIVKHMLNLSEVYFKVKDYNASLFWSKKAKKHLDIKLKSSKTTVDSIQIMFHQPKLILLEEKSNSYLNKTLSENSIIKQIENLDKAAEILEKRKTTIYKNKDINSLLSDYKSITDFSKQLSLKLYLTTNNKNYLNKTIELHEAGIYNRIRSRLNLRHSAGFSDIPDVILNREKELKNNISTSLANNETSFETFIKADNSWHVFLDSLKQNYPKYYKMRYAKIETNLDGLKNNIPKETAIVRYLFINEDLYAFIASNNKEDLVKLNFKPVRKHIQDLAENQTDIKNISVKLYELYNAIWKPFSEKITEQNIIIIPDGELFNLSFETLTPTKINTFNELTTTSLLSKHNISYNYSLHLLNNNTSTLNYSNNFVAFAPEFNDKMKSDYKISIKDSLAIDKTYLKLLPQPFSVNLAKQYSKIFKGSSFLNENASKSVFIRDAKEHKIIHIGTHAESNNISPELSRLIFAKNNANEDNSLYTYEIYNQNLNANLAILTACETGKPTYQSGEGMISLAHAFNYAGSESILTSLWKIDEESSSEIIKSFYNYLAKGKPKDVALKQAKLDYISTAEGRTISPQYWAGLVLIGETAPINITTSSNLWLYIILSVLILITFFYVRRKRNQTS